MARCKHPAKRLIQLRANQAHLIRGRLQVGAWGGCIELQRYKKTRLAQRAHLYKLTTARDNILPTCCTKVLSPLLRNYPEISQPIDDGGEFMAAEFTEIGHGIGR